MFSYNKKEIHDRDICKVTQQPGGVTSSSFAKTGNEIKSQDEKNIKKKKRGPAWFSHLN
jgi:hypothetical protein